VELDKEDLGGVGFVYDIEKTRKVHMGGEDAMI